MATRKPQITFQVSEPLKSLYQEASDGMVGLNVTRLCAAGLLLLCESPAMRRIALSRLNWFENSPAAPRDRKSINDFMSIANTEDLSAEHEKAVADALWFWSRRLDPDADKFNISSDEYMSDAERLSAVEAKAKALKAALGKRESVRGKPTRQKSKGADHEQSRNTA